MAHELPIPPEAIAHPSVEMMRVWLASKKLHIALNIWFWQDRGINERAAWGVLLADMIHHVANAHQERYAHNAEESVSIIRRAFEAEIEHPTSDRLGQFVEATRDGPDIDSSP